MNDVALSETGADPVGDAQAELDAETFKAGFHVPRRF